MRHRILFALPVSVALASCNALGDQSENHGGYKVAHAEIRGRAGSPLRGNASFTEVDGGVRIFVTVRGAPPGLHAVHIHEKGDCSAEDFTSAGGHFNPDGHRHGAPDAPEHHAGDLGNMEVHADGTGTLQIFSEDLTVSPGTHSVVGRSLIIHEKADDFVSQPTGAAGGRIACGEITAQ